MRTITGLFAFLVLSGAATTSPSNILARQDDVAVPEYLKCTQDPDCEVRNIGNCCGRYDRCANVNAELPLPCVNRNDFSSVCGYPVLDECKCGSKGGCISYQNGNIMYGQNFL